MSAWCPALGFCALVVLPGLLRSQVVIEGIPPGACSNCIRLIPEIEVGDDTDGGYVAVGRGLARLSSGEYIHGGAREGMSLFDSRGRFIRTIGRSGSGPMEFRRVDFILVAPGDTLHVFDLGNARHVVVSPLFQQVRQHPFTGQVTNAGFLPNGGVVVNGHIRTLDKLGLPLHILPPGGGGIIRSFGLRPDEFFDANGAWAGWRELTVGRSGTIWVSRRNRYELEEWSAQGVLLINSASI